MYDQETKNLMVVFDKESAEFAAYFIQLIGQRDDKDDGTVVGPKDGSITAALWTEKQYLDNLAQITSNQHVLFLGNFKTAKENMQYAKMDFSEYGMNFGWLGKRAVMYVDSRSWKKDEYNNFVEFAKKDMDTFKGSVSDSKTSTKVAIGVPLFVVGGAIAVGAAALIHRFKLKNIYFKERNYALALHAYLYCLSKFMEN